MTAHRQADERYCIVGAGPGGLATASAFRRFGMDFDIYDQLPTIGGIWDISNQQSPVYSRMRLVSPAKLSGFDGFAMPDSFPDYPGHAEVLGYLHDFARHFDLGRTMRLSTEVTDVREINGRWEVSTSTGTRQTYAGVVLACGHTWQPHLPTCADEFAGEAIHSVRYHRPDPYLGKTVLVVGGGNSGCDIACDLTSKAARVIHSIRRGYYFLPRYVDGQPIAEWARSPAFSERVLGALLGRQLRLLDPFGVPRPNHKLFETNPVINSEIIDLIVAGSITVRSDLSTFEGNTAVFADGSREDIDAVVFATGYQYSAPLLDQHIGWFAGKPTLQGHLFHPTHDRLFVVGLLEHDGSAFPVLSAQAGVIARYLAAQQRGSDLADLRALVTRAAKADLSGGRQFVPSHRHTISLNRAVYLDWLAQVGSQLDELAAFSPRAGDSP